MAKYEIKGEIMKKYLILAIASLFVISGCSNEDEETKIKNDEVVVEENNNQENSDEKSLETQNEIPKEEETEKDNTLYSVDEEEPVEVVEENPDERFNKDYSYILEQERIPFTPELPDWENVDNQIDEIDGFQSMTEEERLKALKQKDMGDMEGELEKIRELHKGMDKAFNEGDYNTYLGYMNKSFREYFGRVVGGTIKSGTMEQHTIAVFPEIIDLDEKMALTYVFKKTYWIEDGERVDEQLTNLVVVYKLNSNEEWEVYIESPIN